MATSCSPLRLNIVLPFVPATGSRNTITVFAKDLKKSALLVRESDLVSTVQDRRHVLVVCSRTRLWWARAAAWIMSVIPVRAVALVLGAECRLCLPQELRLRRVSLTNNAQES